MRFFFMRFAAERIYRIKRESSEHWFMHNKHLLVNNFASYRNLYFLTSASTETSVLKPGLEQNPTRRVFWVLSGIFWV